MVRKLPGVYTSLYDMSTLPEGEANLTVGYVLRANRGKVGEAVLMFSTIICSCFVAFYNNWKIALCEIAITPIIIILQVNFIKFTKMS